MDVEAVRRMTASPAQVAAVMFDPRRDPEWIGGARSVELLSDDPLAPGARVRRHGGFLGRRFSWETELMEYRPDQLLRMSFVAGPMKGGEVVYRIEPDGEGARVAIRNSSPGFSLPGLGWMVRRSVAADLARLEALVRG
jgi:hypothetical protein